MGSPHPLLDGTQALSPQVSMRYEPARFVEAGFRGAAERIAPELDIEYRHPDRFKASSTYRSHLTGRDKRLRMWRGRDEPSELDGSDVDEVEVVRSTHFRKHAVIAKAGGQEVVLVDDIKKERDADHIAQAVREFLALDDEPINGEPVDGSALSVPVLNEWRLKIDRSSEDAESLRASNRWLHLRSIFGLLLTSSVALVTAQIFREVPVLLAPLMFAAASAGYYFLAGALNRTEIEIEDGNLRLQHGPLAWPPTPRIPLSAIQRVSVEQGLPGRPPSYSVSVHTSAKNVNKKVRVGRSLGKMQAHILANALRTSVRAQQGKSGTTVRVADSAHERGLGESDSAKSSAKSTSKAGEQ